MESSLFNRLQATLLAVATAGLFLLAVLNLQQERHFQQPDDGVWWREVPGGLEAEKVLPDMPGQRAGIQIHDLLTGAAVLPDTPAERAEADDRPTSNRRRFFRAGVNPLSAASGDRAGIHPQNLCAEGHLRAHPESARPGTDSRPTPAPMERRATPSPAAALRWIPR